MKYPEFFDTIETIKLKDELSAFLGSLENGIVEFSYLDIVKTSGHSCPTVAGAYLITLTGLKELYKDEIPKRGEIFASFKEDVTKNTTGVISNVISQITGATENSGFKGLNGKFQRYDLMKFNDHIKSSVKFRRIDTNKTVEIVYDPSVITQNPRTPILMKKILNETATDNEKNEFKILWQERVKNIFDNIDKVIKVL